MRAPRRLTVLFWVLVLVAGLMIFDSPETKPTSPKVVGAVTRSAAPPTAASTQNMILALAPRAATEIKTAADAFPVKDWTPPPPPPPPPAPPPPPQAPPVLFSFLGKQLEDGIWTVYLSRQDRLFLVKQGDIIEATYVIDKIAPPTLTLTYLPLKQQQNLAIGAAE